MGERRFFPAHRPQKPGQSRRFSAFSSFNVELNAHLLLCLEVRWMLLINLKILWRRVGLT